MPKEETLKKSAVASKEASKERYIEAVGRRKTAIARVRITPGKASYEINGRELANYFPVKELQQMILDAALHAKVPVKFSVTARVKGGGQVSQAEAVRHGISRALVMHDGDVRLRIKKLGFLKRDPRAKERRKFGLKKARRAPQWSKR